jgi:hypothetical protein
LTAVAASVSSINLSWTAVSGAAGYTLQIASSSNFADAATIATQPGLTFTSTGLLASTTYYYRVEVTATPGLWSTTQSAPATPTVIATTGGTTTTWRWTTATDCAVGTSARYQYDYTISDGYDTGWVGTGNTSVSFTTATNGYTYTVQARSQCYSTVTGTSSSWSGIGSDYYFKPTGNAVAADLMSGKTATTSVGGIVGTMVNMSTANPNGIGAGRSSALQSWTGGGSNVYLKPQAGFYDGIDTWTVFAEPNLVPGNILAGKSILGVAGGITSQPGTYNATWYWADGAGALNQFIPYGAYMTDSGSGSGTPNIRAYDANFVSANILAGKSIFGVAGTGPLLQAGDNILANSSALVTAYGTTPQYLKAIQVNKTGTVRVKWNNHDTWGVNCPPCYAAAQIYKNGSIVSSPFYVNNLSPQPFSYDMSVNAGDVVQLYAWAYNAWNGDHNQSNAFVDNFSICAAMDVPANVIK